MKFPFGSHLLSAHRSKWLACLILSANLLGLASSSPATEPLRNAAKHVNDYVNYGESETPQTIPNEKALQAKMRKLGEKENPALPYKKSNAKNLSNLERAGKAPLLQGRVDNYSSAFHGAGLTLDSLQTPATVTQVRPGSPAYYAGLQKGDSISAYGLEGQTLALKFARAGLTYAVKLQTGKAQLEQIAPAPKAASHPLMAKAEKRAVWQQLSKYQIAILLDRSASMEESIAEGSESRWLWARRIIESFARDGQIQTQKSIIFGTFANTHQISYQARPQQIASLFNATRPGGGTLACPAISEIIKEHFKAGRQSKLLLIIISDGTPDDFDQLSLMLKNMSQNQVLAKALTLVFLGVGENLQGKVVMEYFDQGILQDGARADLVELIPFEQVKAGNLDWALAQAIRHRQ